MSRRPDSPWRRRAAAAVLALAVLGAGGRAAAQTCGDGTGDGAVTQPDAIRILRAAAALPVACDLGVCDVDDDGRLTTDDGVAALRAAAGLPATLRCGDLGPRRGMLRSLTVVVILPAYRALDQAAAALVAAVDLLAAAPAADTLAAARAAWRAERRAWKRTEAFRLGPSETQRTDARIDWSPIRPDNVESTIAAGSVQGASDVDALGATVVGSLAMEHVLFDPAGDAAVLAAVAGPGGADRRAYLRALAANLKERTAVLRAAWEPAQGDFGEELVNAGLIGGEFASLKAAVDELVNRVVFTAEQVEELKLADPLGLNRGGIDPTRLESPRSGSSRADALDELLGIRDVYLGRRAPEVGGGIGGVLAGVSPALDEQVRRLLAEAIAAVRRIPEPLSASLVARPDLVEDAYVAVQAFRRALVLDLAPALGVTLTFGGTDGD